MPSCAGRCAFAKGLHALGVRRGDKVAILMGNRPEWIIADLAICLLGGVMVSVNTWATARELNYILTHSDARYLVMTGRFLKSDYCAMLDEMEPLSQSLPLLEKIIAVGEPAPTGSVGFE
jgi:fatty-acyl-CoA synthase